MGSPLAVGRTQRRHGRYEVPSDQRTRAQRGRDRILYSLAFRRLSGVTQVVAAAEGAIFHNRLTHTLEVAQLGRRLAEKFLAENQRTADALGGIDPEVVEAAALAHDLGHPPFGHIGEKELDRLLRKHRVPDGFEGNAQTFRVVTQLALRSDAFPGLDLTRATLNAILKYPWLRGKSGTKSHEKFGAYRSELADFRWARRPYGADRRKSVEAELMDWADDIAYALHDLDDFYRAGLIPLDRLATRDDEARDFLGRVFATWRARKEDLPYPESDFERGFVLLRQLLPKVAYDGTVRRAAGLRSLMTYCVYQYVNAIHLRVPKSPRQRRVRIDKDEDIQIRLLKQLTWQYVIRNPSLASQQFGQRRILADLFDILRDAADNNRDMLPKGYEELLSQLERGASVSERRALRFRITADIIAGMTEQQAIDMHRRVTGIEVGSVLYPILA